VHRSADGRLKDSFVLRDALESERRMLEELQAAEAEEAAGGAAP
jgi:hypothetical protein